MLVEESRLRMPRICRVVNVDCPLVAVLSDDAGHDFFKSVTALAAAGLQEYAAASVHGSGLHSTLAFPEPEGPDKLKLSW